MEVIMKTSLILLIISTIGSAIYALFQAAKVDSFINSIFIIGLLLLIYSGFQLLSEKGAFSVMRYTFKRVASRVKLLPTMRVTEKEFEKKEVVLDDFLEVEKRPSTIPTLITSLVLLGLSLLLSLIIVNI